MEGPEQGAPDSWELADLDESVSRLMISSSSSKKDDSSSLGFVEDPVPDHATPAAPSSSPSSSSTPSSSERTGGPSEALLNQVDQFLREALEKPRERLSILRMEHDIQNFIRDPRQQQLEFQALPTSYLRLAAHRVAQHYYLHSVAVPDNSMPDGSGSRIVLIKTTSECHLPPIRLADIPVNLPNEDTDNVVKVAIKQRSQKHSQAFDSTMNNPSKVNQLKSVEERKEEYNRARARIFSGNSGSGLGVKQETRPTLPENFQHYCAVSRQTEDRVCEAHDSNAGRRFGESSSNSSRSPRVRMEKEPLVTRDKGNNKVAILRDREVERKDPDYDRSYDRYMQRFDPGFGFSGGPYAMRPMYSPALNYNTEFPQLGAVSPGHRPRICIEQQPRQIPQPMHGLWGPASSPTAHGYCPPEGMMPPFSNNHVAVHSAPGMYLHSPQYVPSPRPGMAFLHPHEHLQSFPQTQQQQPEASFGLARPR